MLILEFWPLFTNPVLLAPRDGGFDSFPIIFDYEMYRQFNIDFILIFLPILLTPQCVFGSFPNKLYFKLVNDEGLDPWFCKPRK